MKLIILLTAFLFMSVQIFGQSIKIVAADDLSTDISGTTVEVVGEANDIIYLDLRVINLQQETLKIRYKRVRDYNSGRHDQLCDEILCHEVDDAYIYISPLTIELESGVPSEFKPQIVPNNQESCAVHSYYVVSEFGVVYDSIQVIFKTPNTNCILSIDKEKDMSFNIFPNPVKEVVTLSGEVLKSGGTVVFTDALGKEVKRVSVSEVNTSIDVNDLNRGVYLVNIITKNGEESSIQRLIKQ